MQSRLMKVPGADGDVVAVVAAEARQDGDVIAEVREQIAKDDGAGGRVRGRGLVEAMQECLGVDALGGELGTGGVVELAGEHLLFFT